MKLRRKRSSGDEGYWKSFTDIMAGLLMVILLVLMLLLLYMTQMNKNTEEHEHDYDYSVPYDDDKIDNKSQRARSGQRKTRWLSRINARQCASHTAYGSADHLGSRQLHGTPVKLVP